MEAAKGTNSVGREARSSLRDVAALTPNVLAALERGLNGKRDNGVMRRLIEGIREAWRERDSAVASLELERADKAPQDRTAEEQAYAGREKVLIVLRCDGFVECYAEGWIDVRLIQEQLADETDADLERRMPGIYRELLFPGKLRCTGMCLLRPELDGAAIAKLLEFEQRVECYVKLEELVGKVTGKVI